MNKELYEIIKPARGRGIKTTPKRKWYYYLLIILVFIVGIVADYYPK